MSQWDDFEKSVNRFARSASRKSARFFETTKLSAAINRLELEIEDVQFELGKAYYEQRPHDPDPAFAEYFDKINGLMDEMQELSRRLLAFKGLQICPACSSTEPLKNEFCGKCGGRLGGYREARHCPNCGAVLSPEDDECPECAQSRAAEAGAGDPDGGEQE